MNNPVPSGIKGWLLVYVIWTAILIATTMFMVYKIQIPPELVLEKLRKAPGGESVADLIYRLSWAYVVVCWAWYLLYCWVLWRLILLREGIVKYVKIMIIGTPVFRTVMPLIAAAAVSALLPGADFWGAVRGAYGQLAINALICNYLYAFVWLAYFMCSARVRNTWPNG